MKVKEIIKYLHNYQKWRRGADLPMPNPKELGIAIDGAIRELRNFQRLKSNSTRKAPNEMPLHIHRKRRKGAYPILLAGSSFGGYVAMHLPH